MPCPYFLEWLWQRTPLCQDLSTWAAMESSLVGWLFSGWLQSRSSFHCLSNTPLQTQLLITLPSQLAACWSLPFLPGLWVLDIGSKGQWPTYQYEAVVYGNSSLFFQINKRVRLFLVYCFLSFFLFTITVLHLGLMVVTIVQEL